jgi:anti-sigma regulatory factor (Ser/Thr protein kinase)
MTLGPPPGPDRLADSSKRSPVTPVDVTLPPTSESARVARAAVADLARALGADRHHDLRLLVTEMVANGVEHGAGPLRLLVHRYPACVRVEVVDQGGGCPATAPASVSAEATSGRGLLLVDALSDRWGVEPGPPARAWLEIALAPARALAA